MLCIMHNSLGAKGEIFYQRRRAGWGRETGGTGGFLRKTAGRMFPRPAVWQQVRSMETIQKDLCRSLKTHWGIESQV